MKRCQWAKTPLACDYHDHIWGKETHDETQLFKMLILEGLQAGLSWETVLKKEKDYDEALDSFDYKIIASYTQKKYEELMNNTHLIRNKRKMHAIIQNAHAFLLIQKEYGSFDSFIWSFVDYQPIIHHYQNLEEIPSFDKLSTHISKVLKKKGFAFVGPTIIYSYLQAIGIYNDHEEDCEFK